MLWLDAYERRARLAPGLLALLPVSVAVTVLGLREAPVVTSIIALFAAAGGPVLSPHMYATWGCGHKKGCGSSGAERQSRSLCVPGPRR